MKNKISMTDCISGIEEVFNPLVTYEGSYVFNASLLSLTSKVDGKRNLVDEYLEKNLFSRIRQCFPNLDFIHAIRLFLVSDLDEVKGRNLRPSIDLFVEDMCANLTGGPMNLPVDEPLTKDVAVEYFRNIRKQIGQLERGEFTPLNEELNSKLKEVYKLNEEFRMKRYGFNYRPLSYVEFLTLNKESLTAFIVGLRSLFPLMEKNIDLKELEKCLDLDKFYLAIVRQLILTTKMCIENYGMVHNSFVFVETYMAALRFIMSQAPYNLTVSVEDLDGSRFKYSVSDAMREYNEIKLSHPEFQIHEIDEYADRDLRDLEVVKQTSQEVKDIIDSKQLAASWNFIENGSTGPRESSEEVVDLLKKKVTLKKPTREQLVQDVNDRMRLFESTNYVYKITGKNNFEGYVGYIYENGVVMFEKFYQIVGSYEPAHSNATYVMTFRNFVEMSKRTKVDIIEYIKQGGTDVRRLYHTTNWCDRVLQIVKGKTYDEKAMEKIDRLINSGELKKKV